MYSYLVSVVTHGTICRNVLPLIHSLSSDEPSWRQKMYYHGHKGGVNTPESFKPVCIFKMSLNERLCKVQMQSRFWGDVEPGSARATLSIIQCLREVEHNQDETWQQSHRHSVYGTSHLCQAAQSAHESLKRMPHWVGKMLRLCEWVGAGMMSCELFQ